MKTSGGVRAAIAISSAIFAAVFTWDSLLLMGSPELFQFERLLAYGLAILGWTISAMARSKRYPLLRMGFGFLAAMGAVAIIFSYVDRQQARRFFEIQSDIRSLNALVSEDAKASYGSSELMSWLDKHRDPYTGKPYLLSARADNSFFIRSAGADKKLDGHAETCPKSWLVSSKVYPASYSILIQVEKIWLPRAQSDDFLIVCGNSQQCTLSDCGPGGS